MKLVRFLMKLTGETVTVILKNGSEVYGTVTSVDMSMNIHLKSAKLKVKNTGDDPIRLDFMTIRGSNIRCIHLPETLQLDSLLIDDVPKAKAKRARIDGTGTGTRGRGRGRGRGRVRGSYRGRQ